MSQSHNDRLISLREVADRFGLSIHADYRLIAGGEFPEPVKVGGASRFYRSDLETYLNTLRAIRK